MGNSYSNNSSASDNSSTDSLNWNKYDTSEMKINLDIADKINIENNVDNEIDDESSPFISTEVYDKIMSQDKFIPSENEILKGGKLDNLSSSSSSTLSSSLSSSDIDAINKIMLTSDDIEKDKKLRQKNMSQGNKENLKTYGFSNSTSDFKTEEMKYVISDTSEMKSPSKYFLGDSSVSSTKLNLETSESSEFQIKHKYSESSDANSDINLNSSSINTSDINLVSVDSINGSRRI